MAYYQIQGKIRQQENVAASVTRPEPMRLLSMGTSKGHRIQPVANNNRAVKGEYRARLQKTFTQNFEKRFF